MASIIRKFFDDESQPEVFSSDTSSIEVLYPQLGRNTFSELISRPLEGQNGILIHSIKK